MLQRLILLMIINLVLISCTEDNSSTKSEAGGDSNENYSISAQFKSYDFGDTVLGTDSSTISINFTNNGNGPLASCSDAFFSGKNSSEFKILSDTCGTNNLSVNNSCSVRISFSPTSLGSKSSKLSWKCADTEVNIDLASVAILATAPAVGADQASSTDEDTSLSITLNAATSQLGNALSYELVTAPTNGSLTHCMDQASADNSADLTCEYTPDPNYNGSDSFTYRAHDGLDSSVATVSLTINSVIDAPTIGADQGATLLKNTATAITLNSASQIEVATLDYTLVTPPANGVLTDCMGESGSSGGIDLTCTFTPDNNYTGSDSFTYKTNNGEDSAEATVTLTIESSKFISIWRTTSSSETVSIPVLSSFSYNFTVDWGDGSGVDTVTAWNDPDLSHTYADAGDYTVTIDGQMENIYFNNNGSKLNLIEVTNLGDVGWKNLERSFYGCSNLTSFAGGNTSEVTKMARMFFNASGLTSLDLSSFDTSEVTDMSYMFYGLTSLTDLNLTNFNTAKVTNMYSMFAYSNVLSSLNVSSFDVSQVENFTYMFWNVSSLETLNLSNFVTTSATEMVYMFYQMSSLEDLNISNFDTTNVTNMNSMFRETSSLVSLDLSHFKMSNVENVGSMFTLTSSLTTLNANNWDISSVTNLSGVWGGFSATVICDQGGSPGTGSLWGKTCN